MNENSFEQEVTEMKDDSLYPLRMDARIEKLIPNFILTILFMLSDLEEQAAGQD